MLTKKAKYGLKAMFFLARQYKKNTEPILISLIAKKERIPKKFLEIILLEMRKQGLLHSTMGKGGGYNLAKPPDKISLGQIIRILDGPLAAVTCVSITAYRRCDECIDEKTCEIRRVMKQVRDATASILDETSLTQAMKSKIVH